ncbi:MAG: hypothetical protein ACE5F9_14610 [Phycisphaerae bacterium]
MSLIAHDIRRWGGTLRTIARRRVLRESWIACLLMASLGACAVATARGPTAVREADSAEDGSGSAGAAAASAQAKPRRFLPQTQGTGPGFHAYTQGHAKEQNPPDLLGGPLTITVSQKDGSTRLVLPGPRFLDPAVFGTPEHPTGFDPAPFPLMGVPLDMRRVVDGKYTFVDHPTPFSNWREVGVGSVRQVVVDATAIDGARTKDKIDLEATFTLPGPDPDDPDAGATRYRVVCNKPLAHGFGFPTFGGVATNHLLHGVTGLGTRLMPTEWTYVDIWGKGDIYKNDKLLVKDHMIHTMVTEIVRGEGYKLRFDGEVGPPSQGITMHLMIPPYKPTPKGMVLDPLKTMFVPFPYIKRHMKSDMEAIMKLPPAERKEQMARFGEIKDLMNWTREQIVQQTIDGKMAGMPFVHIMFGNIEMKASR